MTHPVVLREDWLAARTALFAKERAMTHQLDELRTERRQLPWAQRVGLCARRRLHDRDAPL